MSATVIEAGRWVSVVETAGGVTVLTAGAGPQGPAGPGAAVGAALGGGTAGYSLYVGPGGVLAQEATVSTARLPATLPYKNVANTYTAAQTVQVSDGSVPFTVNAVFAGADVFRWQIGGTTVARINSSGFFAGNGSALTNLVASNVATGTLADARLSSNVPRKDAANTFTAAQRVTFPTTGGGLKPVRVDSTPLAADLFFVDDAGNATVYADLTADRLFGDVGGCTGYPAEEVDGLEAFVVSILAALGLAFNLDFRLAANSAHLSTAV